MIKSVQIRVDPEIAEKSTYLSIKYQMILIFKKHCFSHRNSKKK